MATGRLGYRKEPKRKQAAQARRVMSLTDFPVLAGDDPPKRESADMSAAHYRNHLAFDRKRHSARLSQRP